LNYRDIYLKAAKFENPEYIPCNISPAWPIWNTYREKLEDIARQYSICFPWYKPGSITYDWFRPYSHVEYDSVPGVIYVDEYRYDAFGCLWRTRIKGCIGEVVKNPLDDWSKLRDLKLPEPEAGIPTESGDPEAIISWDKIFDSMEKAKSEGELVFAWLPHGILFLRVVYLRGFRNFVLDLYKNEEKLIELINVLTEYYLKLIDIYRRFSGRIDLFSIGDDLGTQVGPFIGPQHFEKYFYSSYRKIFERAKSIAELVRFHVDGNIIPLSRFLQDLQVDILNIQDRANGVENIARVFKGRKAIDIDISAQFLAFTHSREICEYVKYVIETLDTPRGGLMIYTETYPPTPLENIEALAKALSTYIRRHHK